MMFLTFAAMVVYLSRFSAAFDSASESHNARGFFLNDILFLSWNTCGSRVSNARVAGVFYFSHPDYIGSLSKGDIVLCRRSGRY